MSKPLLCLRIEIPHSLILSKKICSGQTQNSEASIIRQSNRKLEKTHVKSFLSQESFFSRFFFGSRSRTLQYPVGLGVGSQTTARCRRGCQTFATNQDSSKTQMALILKGETWEFSLEIHYLPRLTLAKDITSPEEMILSQCSTFSYSY